MVSLEKVLLLSQREDIYSDPNVNISEKIGIGTGVPQGCVHEPTPFLNCMNVIVKNVNQSFPTFFAA